MGGSMAVYSAVKVTLILGDDLGKTLDTETFVHKLQMLARDAGYENFQQTVEAIKLITWG